MTCKNCGTETDSKFCPECGNMLHECEDEQCGNINEVSKSNVGQSTKKPLSKRLFPKVVTVLMIVTIVVLFFVFYENGNSSLGVAGSIFCAIMLSVIFFPLFHLLNFSFAKAKAQSGNNSVVGGFTQLTPKQIERKARIATLEQEGTVYCPKCLSTSISGNKKGFGIGKAILGSAIATNPLGLVAGNLGAKKVRCTCMKCGYSWMSGKK